MNIASRIENTLLAPDACHKDFVRLLEESMEAPFHAVCIPPARVAWAEKYRGSSPLKICTVIGFPYGYSTAEAKRREARLAVDAGADELDMVMPLGTFKDGSSDERISEEIESVKGAAGVPLKVIIETPFLDGQEILRAARLCLEGKADFVKTCTGIHGGAVLESMPLIRRGMDGALGIKASGGIASLRDALAFVDAGATRIGTSKGYRIWRESLEQSNLKPDGGDHSG